jgi:peroxiredoxin
MQPGFAGVRVPPPVGRGAWGVSREHLAANGLGDAKAHTQLELGFPILCDRGGRIAQLFGVRCCIPELVRDIHRKSGIDLPLLNGDESWTLPIPARFILDKAGLIAYSEISPGQSGSSPPRDVLPVLDRHRQVDVRVTGCWHRRGHETDP